MKFSPKLERVQFLRRYKRFLADVKRASGEELTVHCPNTGRMTNCLVEGSPAWIVDSQNDKRKYRCSLELVTTSTGHIACVNTHRANQLVAEALVDQQIPQLSCYDQVLAEQPYGEEGSRIDFLLLANAGRDPIDRCYVEVKSVTLGEPLGLGYFPDAVSARGQKHLRELMAMREQGYRAVLLFCVQHSGILRVAPADHIDRVYGVLVRQAAEAGVEVLAYRSEITDTEMRLADSVAVDISTFGAR